MFNQMDINRTGEVDYSEFLAAAISSQQTMDAPSVSTAFGLLDKDADGYLTKADLMATIGTDEGGFSERDVDDLLVSAFEAARKNERRATDAPPITPAEVKLTVADFKFLMLARQGKVGPDGATVSRDGSLNKLVGMVVNRQSGAPGGLFEASINATTRGAGRSEGQVGRGSEESGSQAPLSSNSAPQ